MGYKKIKDKIITGLEHVVTMISYHLGLLFKFHNFSNMQKFLERYPDVSCRMTPNKEKLIAVIEFMSNLPGEHVVEKNREVIYRGGCDDAYQSIYNTMEIDLGYFEWKIDGVVCIKIYKSGRVDVINSFV